MCWEPAESAELPLVRRLYERWVTGELATEDVLFELGDLVTGAVQPATLAAEAEA